MGQWMRWWLIICLLCVGVANSAAPPVAFADDFMRTAENTGDWAVQRGKWALQSAWDTVPIGNYYRFDAADYAQNPFAWVGCSTPGESALCTTGKVFWEDYTFSVAVQPAANGAVGVMVNMPDTAHGYLVRWSPANDQGTQGDRLTLLCVAEGKTTVVAEDRGGYIPGQWYQLAVVSAPDRVQVLVDGLERLTAAKVSPARGGIGLYAEGPNGAVFDNVTVYGRTLKKDLISEAQQARIIQRFKDDRNGMQDWAARNDWIRPSDASTMQYYRTDVYGDHWLVVSISPSGENTGELCLALNADTHDPGIGYHVMLEQNTDRLRSTLFRNATQLVTKNCKPLLPATEYAFRLLHMGNTIRLELDGETLLEAHDAKPLTGLRPAYSATGCFSPVRNAQVLGRNMRQYAFTDPPVDWISQGTWMETARWACSPKWSFLSGWSRGDAILWYKHRLSGDQSFETFLGLKMEYPREIDSYADRYRDFGITICGDGSNPRSGYTGIYLAADTNVFSHAKRFVLLRNGVEVAAAYVPDPPDRDTAHRHWFDLELRKHGADIEFKVDGKRAVTYTDPAPLDGGLPAIWTTNNGISVAYAEFHFMHLDPAPRGPQVMLDTPWYPEWTNVNMPLALDFPSSWSTSGKPVHLAVKGNTVPDGDETAVEVRGQQITYTPKKTGAHWYEITAGDDTAQSPPFHLFGPTFNPALGRDDSHTLVLYRFTEGKGEIVHDTGKIGPSADLVFPVRKAGMGTPAWIPGQGLTMRGMNPLTSAHGVPKLMGIAKTHACTLEFWISPDTLYSTTDNNGCLLAWEVRKNQQCLTVGHSHNALTFAMINEDAKRRYPTAVLKVDGFRTGLQHYVLTWDGTVTRWYLNAQMTGIASLDWAVDRWESDDLLFLGNRMDLESNYLGAYYLVAIHDRCLPAEEVLRNYLAGPSAR